jgi:hypothetical protein
MTCDPLLAWITLPNTQLAYLKFNLHISYITPTTCNVNKYRPNLDLIHHTHSLSEHKWHSAHNSYHVNTSHHFTKFDNMNWIPIPLIPHIHKTMIVIIIIITQVFSSHRSLINPCSHLLKHGGNKIGHPNPKP